MDGARAGQVVAVQAAQQCAFAGARGADQHHTFALAQVEVDLVQGRDLDPALGMQGEGFGNAARPHHQCRIAVERLPCGGILERIDGGDVLAG